MNRLTKPVLILMVGIAIGYMIAIKHSLLVQFLNGKKGTYIAELWQSTPAANQNGMEDFRLVLHPSKESPTVTVTLVSGEGVSIRRISINPEIRHNDAAACSFSRDEWLQQFLPPPDGHPGEDEKPGIEASYERAVAAWPVSLRKGQSIIIGWPVGGDMYTSPSPGACGLIVTEIEIDTNSLEHKFAFDKHDNGR